MDYWIYALLWIAWCTLHSTMISTPVTDHLKRRLGSGFRFYRLFFNMVAMATVTPLFLCFQAEPFFRWEGHLIIGQVCLFVIVGFLFIAGMRHYDLLQFLGIRQIRDGASNSLLSKSGRLDSTGILGATRHPWYLAAMIAFWLGPMSTLAIIRNTIMTAYVLVGTLLEERKLVAEFGEEYRQYQKRVSMLIPYRWTRGRLQRFLRNERSETEG